MFHCNGWMFPWAVTAAGGTHVCLPKVEPARVWHELRQGSRTSAARRRCSISLVLARGRRARSSAG